MTKVIIANFRKKNPHCTVQNRQIPKMSEARVREFNFASDFFLFYWRINLYAFLFILRRFLLLPSILSLMRIAINHRSCTRMPADSQQCRVHWMDGCTCTCSFTTYSHLSIPRSSFYFRCDAVEWSVHLATALALRCHYIPTYEKKKNNCGINTTHRCAHDRSPLACKLSPIVQPPRTLGICPAYSTRDETARASV